MTSKCGVDLEKLKEIKIADCLSYSFSKSHLNALEEIHKCDTMYDLLCLIGKGVVSIRGFSQKSYTDLKRACLYRNQKHVCCYQNKYITVYHDQLAQYTGDDKIRVYVVNKYPVDKALSVSFSREDTWGRKLNEGEDYSWSVKNGKVQILVQIDNIKKSEIVLRISEGEQLLNTDFYFVECKAEIIYDVLEEKEDPTIEAVNNKTKKVILNVELEDNKVKSIRFLYDIGVLSETECSDIIKYLKGEAFLDTLDDDTEDEFIDDWDDADL